MSLNTTCRVVRGIDMAEKIGNLPVVLLVLSLCVFLTQPGCDDRHAKVSHRSTQSQFEKENERAEAEFDANFRQKMLQTEKMFEPYRNNGLVKVTLKPKNAEIYIDGGLATIPEKGLMLPIGTYTIKALWPDGDHATKKVFVTPALQQVISWKWNMSRNTRGDSGNSKANISFDAPLSPVNVTLTKPES